ncbi:hypothetical protein YC2023_062858 [Brassica napus]
MLGPMTRNSIKNLYHHIPRENLNTCLEQTNKNKLGVSSDDEQDVIQDLSVSGSQHNQAHNEVIRSIIGMTRPIESSIHV